MPHPNGTSVVMKSADICSLEEYLYSVSLELNSELFEIVPVEFHIHNVDSDVINVNKVDNHLHCFCNHFYFYLFTELSFLFDFSHCYEKCDANKKSYLHCRARCN